MQAKSTGSGGVHPLRAARESEAIGLSQQQLANRAGVTKRTVIRSEKGSEPLVSTALKLARGVGKTVEELWGGGRS